MATAAKKPVPLARHVQVGDLIRHRAKDLDVDFDGTIVRITYNPGLITDDLTESSGNESHDLVNVLSAIITDWPLADEDGSIPVGPKHAAEVGRRVHIGVLRVLYEAIMGDNMPNPQSARNSSSTSPGTPTTAART
jgi:hypothetical protein